MIVRRGVIALWLLGLAICAAVIARTAFSTDMSAFLPRSPRPAQRILVDQLRDGAVSRLILVGIEGAAPDTLAALSRDLTSDLRGSQAFAVVNNGERAALGPDTDVLWRNRYLLSPAVTPEHFAPEALHAALLSGLRLLGSDLGVLASRALPSDPTGEMPRLIEQLTGSGAARPASRGGVFMSGDGTRALLMVQTRAPGFDIDAQEMALGAIEAAFAKARLMVPDAALARLIETGPPVFAVRARAHMKSDAQTFSTIATILVSGILLLAYRSVRLLGLALLPVASGVLAGVAGVSLAFGFVHAITLGFGVTLIGEAVDYAIYLFTQTAPGAAVGATLPRIWPTLRLGMLTSVCGFSAMLLSSFTGFAQLGLFTITGLLVALGVTRWVIPALTPRGLTGGGSTGFSAPLVALTRAGRLPRLLIFVLTAVAGGVLIAHSGPYWEDELTSMSPLTPDEKARDTQLRGDVGAPGIRYLIGITAASRDAALAASDLVATHLATLGVSFESPGQILPGIATQLARQAALPDPAIMAANLDKAIAGTPFRPEIFAPFLADIATARTQRPVRREDLEGTSLALRLDSLLSPGRDGWLATMPLRGVTDLAALANALREPGAVLIDLKAESDQLLAAYLREALMLSIAGSGVIAVLLCVSLRKPRRIAAVLLPLAAAVVCTAALMLAINTRLSIFNLFGLLLVAAVGSNYCLFFEREDPAGPSMRRMTASLMLADVCTVIGFGILGFSATPVLRGIGTTVAAGAALCLVFGAVLSSWRVAR